MSNQFSNNPHYRRYQQLLVELHGYFCRGMEEGEQLEALWELMADEASFLSAEEKDRVGALSGDLYLLQHDEIYTHVPGHSALPQLIANIDDARRRLDWNRVLTLLRTRPETLPDGAVARIRGHAYLGLEEFDAARPFLEFALEHYPNEPTIRFEYLTTLISLEDAVRAAEIGGGWQPKSPQDALWLASWANAVLSVDEVTDTRVTVWLIRASDLLRWVVGIPEFDLIAAPLRKNVFLVLSAVCLRVSDLAGSLQAWQHAVILSDGDEEAEALLQFQGEQIVAAIAPLLAHVGVNVQVEMRTHEPPTGQQIEERLSPAIKEYLAEGYVYSDILSNEEADGLVGTGA